MEPNALDDDDVVITGRGIVSPLGNTLDDALVGLRQGRCAIGFDPEFAERGFRSQVSGRITGLDPAAYFTPEQQLSMSKAALYSSAATMQAVRESGLTPDDCAREMTGVVLGSGIAGLGTSYRNYDTLRASGSPRRVGGHGVDTTMASTCAANAAVLLRTRGVGEALSSACATGVQCIGYAYRLIRHGYQDTVVAGAADEDGWETAYSFDAMRALCADSNDRPERASRPLDATRSGFVASGGSGVVVLERYARARARGARPLARVAGYWSSSDGSGDMMAPSADGQVRVVAGALRSGNLTTSSIDYVNLHGTSTKIGDVVEMTALASVLGEHDYLVSSSKSQIGHALGAAGAIELVLALLMLQHGFVGGSLNVERLDPALERYRRWIAFEPTPRRLRRIMSNSFGFGSTNASIILDRVES